MSETYGIRGTEVWKKDEGWEDDDVTRQMIAQGVVETFRVSYGKGQHHLGVGHRKDDPSKLLLVARGSIPGEHVLTFNMSPADFRLLGGALLIEADKAEGAALR